MVYRFKVQMNPDFAISIPAIIAALKNNMGRALLTLLFTLALAALAIIFLPREYRSEAIIFVRLGRESVSLDPTATTGSTISVLESRENEVNSIRDMLQSRTLLESVVDSLGPKVVLGKEEIRDQLISPEDWPTDDYEKSPRQMAIKLLFKKLYVQNARKSSVLLVGVDASAPKLAQRILQVYLESYKAMHTSAHQTPDSNQFFAKQSNFLREQWRTMMKDLQDLKKEAGVVSIESARENLKGQINETQSQIMEIESRRDATIGRIAELNKMRRNPLNIQRTRELLVSAKTSLASMDAEYETLKLQRNELLEKTAVLNRNEVKIRQMKQEVNVAEVNYAQYRELHEQTRIEEAMFSSKITNVKIVQQPSFIPKAVSPKKRLIAAAGLMAGLAGAFMIAMVSEFYLKRRRDDTPSPTSEGSISSLPSLRITDGDELTSNANA